MTGVFYYTFVYDTAVTIVAHATNPLLVGVNFKGKTDAAGKPFRDEIVQGALDHGTGWEDYIYTKPDQSGGVGFLEESTALVNIDRYEYEVAP